MIKLSNGTPIACSQTNLLCSNFEKKPLNFKTSDDYERYVLYGLEEIYQNNLFFHHIPKSFKVYSNQMSLSDDDISFHLSAINPDGQFTHVYEFVQPIDLVSLNMKSNITVLLATAIREKKQDIIKILTDNSGYSSSIVKFLCSMDFNGFTAHEKTHTLYVCQPAKFLKYVKTIKIGSVSQK